MSTFHDRDKQAKRTIALEAKTEYNRVVVSFRRPFFFLVESLYESSKIEKWNCDVKSHLEFVCTKPT